MRIKLSRKIGFCFGVKRAVAMAERALKKEKNRDIYSLGSIIHNRQVVEDLERKGLRVIKNIGRVKKGVVVISSHGLSPKLAGRIPRKGIKVIDTTCPFVSNAQRTARRLGEEGYGVVIVGDAGHPEIKALVDFVPGASRAKKVFVLKDKKEARALRITRNDRIGVISQTTQSPANFLDVVGTIAQKRPGELRVFNTICNDAEERQSLASCLARHVGAMLIVGGKNSANTKRLFEVCRKILDNSYLVETDKDLKKGWFKAGCIVGITSGASTPEWTIRKVVAKIKKIHPASPTMVGRLKAS